MPKNDDLTSLPKGRARTDKSLSTERARTDRSLADERTLDEKHADREVLESRREADVQRSKRRLEIDGLCDTERAAQGAFNQDERTETDERLRQERDTADAALQRERWHVDSVLESERWQKKVAERKFFQDERLATDENLTSERNLTDLESKRVAAELTTRDEFLAIVSHDLRNPLGAISIAAELLTESLSSGPIDDEGRQYLEVIGRSASEALRLIGDLLDMERMAEGKLILEIREVEAGAIIRPLIKAFELQALEKNIAIRAVIPDGKLSFAADFDRLKQVLANLLSNALKFTPVGGSITVSLQPIDGALQMAVADTGPGLPPHMVEAVFDRFFQINKRDSRGLGLGLYISKMIVEAHQGRLWVETKQGEGCTFRCQIPTAVKTLAAYKDCEL